MPTYECDDYRVTFTRVGPAGSPTGEYTVVAEYDGGRAASTFRLPMSATRLEELVLHVARSGTREIAPDEVQAVHSDAETLGSELGAALFDDVIGPAYVDAQRNAATRGKGIRLTLALGGTPELLSVPWELLYRKPRFLASQRHTPVVRYLDVGDVSQPLPIDGPARVLGVVASPDGLTPLDVDDERARVEQALAPMIALGRVELEWCHPATRRSLRERLRDGTFHILHFVGHSDFDATGEGAIYLLDQDGGADAVNESVLTALLGDQTSLRLVVLNSCKGARTSLTDPFSGIATSLVALGLPAVVAMQFSISDDAAIVFAEELFTSLIGRQYPIDASVSEARKAVFAEVSEIEWATPVLFLRSTEGRLFDFAAAPEAIPLKAPPLPLLPLDEEHPDVSEPQNPPDPNLEALRRLTELPMPEYRPSRRKLFVVGSLVVVAVLAAGGVVAWRAMSDDGSTAFPVTTGEDPVDTDVVVTQQTTTSGAPTCAGDTVPLRPPLTGLSPEFDEAFAVAQGWVDLLAAAQPGADNSEVAAEIAAVFPDGGIHSSDDLEGYTGLEASHLLPVNATTGDDGTTTLDVAGLVYDNATPTSPCRTGFLCSRYTVATNGTLTSFDWTAPPPLESSYPYHDGVWFAPDDASPAADRLTVSDWFRRACAAQAPS